MGGRYERYPDYRDSGAETLGEIPYHWDARHVRYLLKNGAEGIKIGPFGSALKLDDMVEFGVRVYGQENVIKKDFTLGKRKIDQKKFDEMQVYQVFPDDLLVTMMGTSGKCELVPQGIDIGIIDSHLLRLRTKDSQISPRFFQLLIDECYEIECQIQISGKGSIMHGLNSSIVKSLLLPIPSKDEQEKILTFLDHETAKIDTLIEKQQQLIKLLREKRQAVISHAVTKGLNPDAPMKNSGVEWLGDVPEHWGVVQLRRIGKVDQGSAFSHDIQGQSNGNIPWFKVSDMNRSGNEVDMLEAENYVDDQIICRINTPTFPKGTVIFPRVGAALLTNKRRILSRPSVVDDNIYCIIPQNINSRFLYFFMLLVDMTRLCSAGLVPTVTFLVIKNIYVSLPSKIEQEEIVTHVEQKLEGFDKIVKQSKTAINLLRERRTALISAAVTGKIDVRNWQAPTPQNNQTNKDIQ